MLHIHVWVDASYAVCIWIFAVSCLTDYLGTEFTMRWFTQNPIYEAYCINIIDECTFECRVCSTQYRLVCLKSMPPEECYQRKVRGREGEGDHIYLVHHKLLFILTYL